MITEILCRFDALKQAPVVFLSDTIQGDKVQVWSEGGKAAPAPLDYYHMTRHLSASDERVLMERFAAATNRDLKTVKIRHRLPRVSKALPDVLSTAPTPTPAANDAKATTKRTNTAMPLDQQPAPQGPQGDVPQPGEGLTLAAPAERRASDAPVANELPSAALFRRINELNARVQELTATHANLMQQMEATVTDLNASKQAATELIEEYKVAMEAEAAAEARKREEMLASLTASVAPVLAPVVPETPTPVAEQPAKEAAPVQAPATPPKAASKPPAKSASKKK